MTMGRERKNSGPARSAARSGTVKRGKPGKGPGATQAANSGEPVAVDKFAGNRVAGNRVAGNRVAGNKVALVTGSAKRLGREIALGLAGAGYFTWVHYLTSRPEAEGVLAEIKARGGRGGLVKGDMSSKRDIAAMAAKVGKES
nr:SDR family NAD(P)-dependent oxidoreductase [Fibrobacterota bacterium]